MGVQILGVREAEAKLIELGLGVRQAGERIVLVGTNARYAWGIHFGRRRDGRLARKLGGALYLTDAARAVQPSIGPTVKAVLSRGPRGLARALYALGLQVERAAKTLLTERVYAVPIPTFGFRLTAKGLRVMRTSGLRAALRYRSKRPPRKRWTRTGNLRASIHTRMIGG